MESAGKNGIDGVDSPPVMSDEEATQQCLNLLLSKGVLDDVPDEQFINNSESLPNAVGFLYLCR